jgi:TolA-binding protein
MKYSLPLAVALALAALLESPRPVLAQSKEVIATQGVQREVFALEEKLNQFQTNQAERMAALETLLKDALASNKALSTSLDEMKRSLTQSLTEQQSRIAEPIATVKNNMEDLSQSMTGMREQLASLERRSKTNEGNLEEIVRGVRALNEKATSAPPPAPAATPGPNATAAPSADGGAGLYTNALRDYSSGKDVRAMDELQEFLKTYPSSPDAPQATFLMGKLYDKAGQNDDARQAFDRVLEQYPENPTKPDALFEKAEQLLKLGKRPEALGELRVFVTRYPNDPNLSAVQARIKELQTPVKPAPAKPTAAKGKRKP